MSDFVTPRIDVHMLTMMESDQWRRDCVASLDGAPIQLHVIDGVEGNLGTGRVQGYKMGSLPYVSHVDPDDLYNAEAFTQMADILDANPDVAMVYSAESIMRRDGTPGPVMRRNYDRQAHLNTPRFIHGVVVFRRAVLEQFYDTIETVPNWADWVTTLLMAKAARVMSSPVVGRHWRQHESQSSRNIDAVARRIVDEMKATER